MSTSSGVQGPETYLSNIDERGQLIDLAEAMKTRGIQVEAQPALVTSDGTRHDLTPGLAELLAQVVEVLSQGQGVTVVPRQRMLTTQEAADLLNVSRPTLIKRLEAGDLPFEMRGRHRRIRLEDLLDYQRSLRVKRSTALEDMQRTSQEAGLYDLLDGPASRTT